VSSSLDETRQLYEKDEVTNSFLKRHPVHCEFRTGKLPRKRLHFHEGCEIYLCLGGSGSYIVEEKLYPLHAGTLTIIGPNVVHHPYSGEDSFSRYILTIDEAYLATMGQLCGWKISPFGQFLGGSSTSSHYFLTAAQSERARSAAAGLAELLSSPDPLRELAMLHRLTEVMLLIGELQHSPAEQQLASGANERLIQEVVACMAASYRDQITIDGLLERFPVSRSKLLQLFKATTGFTVTQLLTEYRLNQAKRLLAGTDWPMTEIAAQSGFGDLSHFYHVFRRESGITPRQYRQKALAPR
jgi:AraC-like DNA-binding protein/mannose-6-phosphate isomerase-like protein (cupin superfamily)